VRETFSEASAALGQDLWALVEDGPDEALNQTVNTQPAMLAADIAVYRAWRVAGGAAPRILAGHSLGEYAALVAAGALTFADALPLVRFRAQAMQEAVPAGVGAMAAVMGLDAAGVTEACREAAQGQVVEAVNFNAPDQIVIAGHREAVERAGAAAKAANPVRWVETIQGFVARGVTHIVECGPGKVLTGLTKRIAPELTALPLNDTDAIAAAIEATRGGR
jgi:[acyl-carrier-protein] S-malonyltransferase